jgi:hypothetical protein
VVAVCLMIWFKVVKPTEFQSKLSHSFLRSDNGVVLRTAGGGRRVKPGYICVPDSPPTYLPAYVWLVQLGSERYPKGWKMLVCTSENSC